MPLSCQRLPVRREIEGGPVARREQPKTLKVRRSFEPNRLAEASLAEAYEHVLPIVRRNVWAQRTTDASREGVPERRVGGVAPGRFHVAIAPISCRALCASLAKWRSASAMLLRPRSRRRLKTPLRSAAKAWGVLPRWLWLSSSCKVSSRT